MTGPVRGSAETEALEVARTACAGLQRAAVLLFEVGHRATGAELALMADRLGRLIEGAQS